MISLGVFAALAVWGIIVWEVNRRMIKSIPHSSGEGGSSCTDLLGAGPDGPGASESSRKSELADLIERVAAATGGFQSKVDRRGPDDCWPWMGYRRPSGPSHLPYGVWRYAKTKVVKAHRAAWMAHHGREAPAGALVCHTCDNPPCCNPAHLFLGTAADNNRDRDSKGRHGRRSTEEGVRFARGEAHGGAKLSVREVEAIRADPRALGPISEAYGVSTSTISRIRRGKRWASV